MKLEIDYDKLEWWMQPLIVGMLLYNQMPDEEELKRYAELAGTDEPQELEDKKPLG